MNMITFPLQPGMQGSAVADLQDALQLLIERQVIKTFTGRKRPTVKELQALAKTLKQERKRSIFGDATDRPLCPEPAGMIRNGGVCCAKGS